MRRTRGAHKIQPGRPGQGHRLGVALPAEHDVPLSRWSAADLAAQLRQDGIAASVSTVRCWLDHDALKPWQHRSWIFVRDPDFEAKAAVVLDLYARTYQGTPWAPMST